MDLQGESRSVRVDAERSDDIRQDVQDITESVADDYRVRAVALRFIAPHLEKRETSDVAVDLSRMLATAEHGVTISDMLSTSLRVLAHRNQVPQGEIERIVSTSAQPIY